MRQVNTIMLELLKLFPRYEFEKTGKTVQGELLYQVFHRVAAVDRADVLANMWERQPKGDRDLPECALQEMVSYRF